MGEHSPGVLDPGPIFILHYALRRGEALPIRPQDILSTDAVAGALMRVIPVRGAPFSVIVRVAVDGTLVRTLVRNLFAVPLHYAAPRRAWHHAAD